MDTQLNKNKMNQSEFNKKDRFEKLLKETIDKKLGYRFLLEEMKRNHWNVNMIQSADIANRLDVMQTKILFYAYDLNILNVDKKTLKAIQKQRNNQEE